MFFFTCDRSTRARSHSSWGQERTRQLLCRPETQVSGEGVSNRSESLNVQAPGLVRLHSVTMLCQGSDDILCIFRMNGIAPLARAELEAHTLAPRARAMGCSGSG